MYFSSFPKIVYDSSGQDRPKVVTNILRRVAIRAKVKDNAMLYDTYDIRNGDTPESLAHQLYKNPQQQDSKRRIKLLDPRFVDQFVQEFESLIGETPI